MNFQKRRKEALRAYRSTIENAGFEVETHVVRGTPHRRINGIAESIAADLILVGSRGKSPLENRVIGSTARNLARTTVVPLLVDRIERGVDDPDPIRRHLFKRTLFATDFSENAERAFQAFEYLRHATEEVTLVHVESPKDDAGGEADPDERLADLADRLGDWGLDARTEVRRGDPAKEILAAETEYDPSTLLVGSRAQPAPTAPVGERLRGGRCPRDRERLSRAAAAHGVRAGLSRRRSVVVVAATVAVATTANVVTSSSVPPTAMIDRARLR